MLLSYAPTDAAIAESSFVSFPSTPSSHTPFSFATPSPACLPLALTPRPADGSPL